MTLRKLLLSALGVAAVATPALAGWNHVALPTCNDGPVRRAFKPSADCDTPAPAPKPTVRYETTTHYEPMTVMRAEKYTEEVPVQVKSYYYEPVQTYTYRSYYDPCSGQCQQIAVPRTTNVRKEDVRTEVRYLEKTRMVPVQVEREVTETRPVYTYYGPTVRKYGPTTDVRYAPAPGGTPRPGSSETYNPIPPQNLPITPGSSLPKRMPEKAIDKIESRSYPNLNALSTSLSKESGAKVYGSVTGLDQETPVPNGKLVFVRAADQSDKRYITADKFGGFDANLPAGEWLVYAGPGNGQAAYVSKFKVAEGDKQPLTVAVK